MTEEFTRSEIPDSGTPHRAARVRVKILSTKLATPAPVTSNAEAYLRVVAVCTTSGAGTLLSGESQEAGFDLTSTLGVVVLYDGMASGIALRLRDLFWASDTSGTTTTTTLLCFG